MTITTGFSAGLSIAIIIGQIKNFFGLTLDGSPIEGIDRLDAIIKALGTFNYQSFIVGAVSLIIMILLHYMMSTVTVRLLRLMQEWHSEARHSSVV